MNKKNVLKLFKKAVDKDCVLNTKLRERKILHIMGEEHEVDSDLLYKVAMIGYTAQERDGTLNELFNGYCLEGLRDYPIELNRWGFFRDWYFSWVSNTSKKPSHNSFEFTAAALGEKDKIACVIKVPVIWYMLAVYPNVDVDMLEEMEPEHFEMLRLNKNLSDSIKLLIKNK